ncbi:MAG: apolipoprotein N-acyltransferase [Candidatus Obscuribacterales bacterium]|nr:apolipoprotein N-acyltransferase [Candidatus Obscuribacterales bacterium]
MSRPAFLAGIGLFERLPLALIFGALLGLSSPGFDIWWLAWVGFVPLFVLLRASGGLWDAGLSGLAFGFAYHLVCHRWILELYPLTVVQIHDLLGMLVVYSLWFIESMHQALLLAVFAVLTYALPMRAGLLPHYKRPFFSFIFSVPLIYVFLQWTIAPSEPFLGVPVNQLAYTQTAILPIMQVLSLGGCQLLEYLLLLVNAALAVAVFEFLPMLVQPLPDRVDPLSEKSGAAIDFLITLLIVLSAAGWGEWRLRKLTEFPPYLVNPDQKVFAPPVPVAVLQGNIPVRPAHMEEFGKGEKLDKYSKLAQDLGVAMFILPEAVLRLQESEGKTLFSRLAGICAFQKKEAAVGSFEFLDRNLVDALRFINATGSSDSLYAKTRLLPFVESAPFSTLAKVIPENLFGLLPSSKNNFLVAPSPYLLKSIWGNVGASISFELLYPELIASEVDNGAALLVNVSDLSWFHNNVLAKQLLAAAICRAVENGRYLVLASNTGTSAVVNPLGVVTSRSLSGQSGNLIDRVQFLSARTHFTRMWWLWRPSYRIWWH